MSSHITFNNADGDEATVPTSALIVARVNLPIANASPAYNIAFRAFMGDDSSFWRITEAEYHRLLGILTSPEPEQERVCERVTLDSGATLSKSPEQLVEMVRNAAPERVCEWVEGEPMRVCEWMEGEPMVELPRWDTSCSKIVLDDHDFSSFEFCPFCGGKLVLKGGEG